MVLVLMLRMVIMFGGLVAVLLILLIILIVLVVWALLLINYVLILQNVISNFVILAENGIVRYMKPILGAVLMIMLMGIILINGVLEGVRFV
jgi:hypothetical protein